VHTDDVHDLVFAGISLALAYLTRYDAVAAIAATTFLVAGVTVMRQGRAKWRTMRRRALLDAVLVAGPGFSAFVVWTATSWLITGEALAQLSSNYGNAAILEQSGGGATGTLLGNTAFVVTAIVVLGPTLLIAGPVAAVLAHRRRDLEFLVAPVMFGSVLAFQAFSYITGSTFGFLRFYICAIPLAAIVVVQIFAPQGNPETRRTGKFHRSRSEHATAKTGVSAALVALSVGGMMVTGWAMLQPSLSAQQYALRYLFDENPSADADALAARRIIDSFSTERELAAYLDSQNLPEGSILVDTVYGDDDDQTSFDKTAALLQSHPDLKGIISPTTVGIAAAARYVSTSQYKGEVAVTGLGTPNQMREYVEDGTVAEFALWNPGDLGYLAAYAAAAIAGGDIEGEEGDTFEAGKLGEYTVGENSVVLLGEPFRFNADNIGDFDF